MITIDVPVKIGEPAWCIRNFKGHKIPQCGIVSAMFFSEKMELMIVVKYIGRGKLGETVFANEEDAKAFLEKRYCR